MIRFASSILLLVGLASAAGCSRAEETPPPIPPTLDQIQADLVGQPFVFFVDADGEREWTIEAQEIRDVQIVDTVRAEDGDRLRIRTHVILAAPNRTIQGDLQLDYQYDGARWQLLDLRRVGPNFVAGDASFVLYDVSPLADDTLGRRRGLSLDVIARYAEGTFTAPFEGYRARINALADSVFVGDSLATSDSLRQLAESELASEIGSAFAPRGRTVRVLRPGEAPMAVRIGRSEVGILGCEYLNAQAPSDQSLGREAALATTSSVVGGASVPGRALTATERRQLDQLARERFRVQGLDGDRVRSGGSVVIDLDGDGREEWVGAFSVGSEERATSTGMVIAARPMEGNPPRLVFERRTQAGFGSFTLVGAVDLDADRAAEVVLLEQGYEAYQYLILTHRAGRFVTAFRGGGGGC